MNTDTTYNTYTLILLCSLYSLSYTYSFALDRNLCTGRQNIINLQIHKEVEAQRVPVVHEIL